MNIILAHGILGFDKIGYVAYFNAVEEHIKKKYGSQVLITKVSATGSITERGEQLREQILNALITDVLDPADETHIIAHSMGGLDSRYILSPKNKDNIAELITSLTTIGTPHRGSPIADAFYPLLDAKSDLPFVGLLEGQARNFLDFFGISTEGLRDLTTDVLTTFDKDYVDSDEVSYFWTAGIGRSGAGFRTSIALLPTYEYIHKTGKTNDDKSNDGVVPLSSAVHGEAIGRPWLADHLDEVGHDLDDLPTGTPKHFDYLDRYDEIINRILPLKKQKQ
jgi:triacylglycerol lipase